MIADDFQVATLYLNKKKPYTGILYRTLPDFVSFIAQNIFDMIAGVPHRSNAHIVAWFQAFHDRECFEQQPMTHLD